jgi:hypothetical protein
MSALRFSHSTARILAARQVAGKGHEPAASVRRDQQGLKPVLYFEAFAAVRAEALTYQSGPVTKLLNTPPILSFSAA